MLDSKTAFAFGCLYFSYVVLYFCRKNYGFWLNDLITSGKMTQIEASAFGSTMELAYGAGKLFAGPIADNSPPVKLLVGTMLISALANGLMFTSGIYVVDLGLWAINGFAQAFTWPALALVFFQWFGKSPIRGTLYSILSTNQNVGSALTPILLTPLVSMYGWRVALWGPAMVCSSFAIFLALFLSEKPPIPSNNDNNNNNNNKPDNETTTTLLTKPAVITRSTSKEDAKPTSGKSKSRSPPPPGNRAASTNRSNNEEEKQQPKEAPSSSSSSSKSPEVDFNQVMKRMLKSPKVWMLGLGYALLTFVRVGISDWSLVFLQKNHKIKLEDARDCLVFYEFGGFVGGIASGVFSDYIFAGKRGPVMVFFTGMLLTPTVWALFFSPGVYQSDPNVNSFVLSGIGQSVETTLRGFYWIIGFASFGPHTLVGLVARELFPEAPSTAGSFAKSLAQIGGSLAGVPVSLVSTNFGWDWVGVLFCTTGGLAAVCFVTLEGFGTSGKKEKTE